MRCRIVGKAETVGIQPDCQQSNITVHRNMTKACKVITTSNNHVCKRMNASVFILLAAVILALPSCQSDLEAIQTIVQVDEGPVESAFNVEIIYSDQARVRMILNAAQMDRYENEDSYLEMPQGLHVVFFDTLMQQTSSMRSKYAISYEDSEIIEARNDVVVVNEQGETLNTEQLIWDQKEEIIYSEKFVKITSDDEVTYGEGFRADERFDRWEITNPRGTFRMESP